MNSLSRLSVVRFLDPSRAEEVSLMGTETCGFNKPAEGPDQAILRFVGHLIWNRCVQLVRRRSGVVDRLDRL